MDNTTTVTDMFPIFVTAVEKPLESSTIIHCIFHENISVLIVLNF